jgi:hypothetical protein
MFLEGGQNMHCFLAMFPEGTWTRNGILFPSHVSRRWTNQETLFPSHVSRRWANQETLFPSHVSRRWTNQETLFPSHVSRRWANQIQQQYRVLTVFNLTVKFILAVLYYTFRVIQVFNLKMSFCSMLSVMSCFLLENLQSCTVWRRTISPRAATQATGRLSPTTIHTYKIYCAYQYNIILSMV